MVTTLEKTAPKITLIDVLICPLKSIKNEFVKDKHID
jgi:hypothetical protein